MKLGLGTSLSLSLLVMGAWGTVRAQEQFRLGSWRYASEGVVEVGAALGVGRISDRAQIDYGLHLGWFFADRIELSALLWLHDVEPGGDARSYLTGLVEPSFHHRFNPSVLGFMGLGLGLSHVDDVGDGLALAPRMGLKIVLGRAGLLSSAFQLLWSASQVIGTNEGPRLAMNGVASATVGYAFAW